MKNNFSSKRITNIYNTPLEVGMRILILLSELDNNAADIDRLVIYDYFMLHGNDFDEDIESLHPATPYRAGEIYVKRKIIQESINLMHSKELLNIEYTKEGIFYKANELTKVFLEYLDTQYAKDLLKYSRLVIKKFNSYSNDELNVYINKDISKWGSEFTRESLIRGWNSE